MLQGAIYLVDQVGDDGDADLVGGAGKRPVFRGPGAFLPLVEGGEGFTLGEFDQAKVEVELDHLAAHQEKRDAWAPNLNGRPP